MPTRPARIRQTVAVVGLLAVLTAGCTSTIGGEPAKIGAAATTTVTADTGPSGPKAGVAPATVAVTHDGKTQWDTQAKNTIADLYAYYAQIFPTDFHQNFTPAKALISYDSNTKGDSACGRSLYQEVNASYNPACDTIVWDRGVLLPQMAKDVGPLAAPTVLSHEMGHLVQARLKVPITASTPVIMLEQQADCYAGSYWRWVADGHSAYYNLNQTDGLRQVLTAMMSTGDPVGLTATANQAHGSGFDRTFAFSLGYASGAVRCSQITAQEVAARIKETGFTGLPTNYGNVTIDKTFIDAIAEVADAYFAQQVAKFRAPTLLAYTGGTAPACAGAATTTPVGYCPATNTISYNLAELQRIGTPTAGYASKSGDFSAVILLVSRFGLAAQASAGGSATGGQAGLRALCDSGGWAGWMFQPRGSRKLQLSPNDLDKAVYEVMSSPLPSADAAGTSPTRVIDQVQALYIGVIYGSAECRDFYSS